MKIKSKIELLLRYFKYCYFSKHSFGHGIHSPFIFDFVSNVLFAKEKNRNYGIINNFRKGLHRNKQGIDIVDKGAGSININSNQRLICEIAKTSSIKSKYGKLLARIVEYYKPSCLIELGTSLGISSAYLGFNLQNSSKLYTIEGDLGLYQIAKQNLSKFFEGNVISINGGFDEILPKLLDEMNEIDLVFFDGNHKKEPTLHYFELCLKKSNNQSIFIFDDIHWSSEMEEAWECIKLHPETRVCIDLFQLGIVFFRKELSCENYIIRF